MTMATRTARRSRSALMFLAAVLAVAVGLIAAGPASALTASAAETRVGASASAAEVAVEPSVSITAGQRLGNDPPRPQIVVATGVAANAEAPLIRLTAVESRANPKTLADHFGRHGGDFGATSADEYAQMASEFFQRGGVDGLPTKIASDGTIRMYDPASNTFGSFNPAGQTRTFSKPDPAIHGYPTNWDYWVS